MSSELSVGGKLAKAATALLNEMDPDTFLHGIEPLKAALEGWTMAKTTPNDTALRRAGLYLDGLAHNGCNEVKTLRRLVVAAQQQGEPIAWMLEGMVGGNELAFQKSDLQDVQNRYGGEFVPLARHPVAQSVMQSMETAPRDGTHILVKYIVTQYVREPWLPRHGEYFRGDYRPVGHKWEEFWFVDGKFETWGGTDKTRTINGGGEPIGWVPLPHDKTPEVKS
jgi:hypothetical protein